MTLLERTKSLLRHAKAGTSLRKIADASNGIIEYDWLKRFHSGAIKHPSVIRVQTLHDYLKSPKKPAA